MGIKPNKPRSHQHIALNMATQVSAEPYPRLQRLYGNPEDRLMAKADGRKCEVSFLRYLDVSATEENLESRIAEQERNSNLGFLPVQLDNDSGYKVYIYRVIDLPD